jgi:hypothetical protein
MVDDGSTTTMWQYYYQMIVWWVWCVMWDLLQPPLLLQPPFVLLVPLLRLYQVCNGLAASDEVCVVQCVGVGEWVSG